MRFPRSRKRPQLHGMARLHLPKLLQINTLTSKDWTVDPN
jgi:hypothetical protein